MTIEPDMKDWTWVLSQRCPECGYDASSVLAMDVAGLVRRSTDSWADVLSRTSVRRRPRPDRWSPLEYGCHVRDVCALYLERLDLMLTSDDPLFANWDQDATAVERRYDEQEPAVVANELVEASDALTARLDSIGEG